MKINEMVVLLQDVRTLEFVDGEGGWTSTVEEALDFGEIVGALDYALGHGLRDVQPVVMCGDPELDVKLPALWVN